MTNEKLGIIAGEGKMPVYIARQAAQKGVAVAVAGLKGNAREEDFRGVCTVYKDFRLGQMGAGLKFFKEHGVARVLMAGRVQHTSIFSNLMPDLRGAKFRALRTKHILSRVIEEFKKEGIEFVSSALYFGAFYAARRRADPPPPDRRRTKSRTVRL